MAEKDFQAISKIADKIAVSQKPEVVKPSREELLDALATVTDAYGYRDRAWTDARDFLEKFIEENT